MQVLTLNIILSLLITGCGFSSDYKSDKILSPTKKYYLTTSVNRTIKAKNDFADVIIHLYSFGGQELSDFNTHAGDANKWTVGWDETKDTIVLFSSDIGNAAYSIQNGQLRVITLTDELNKRAMQLKQEKYKQ